MGATAAKQVIFVVEANVSKPASPCAHTVLAVTAVKTLRYHALTRAATPPPACLRVSSAPAALLAFTAAMPAARDQLPGKLGSSVPLLLDAVSNVFENTYSAD